LALLKKINKEFAVLIQKIEATNFRAYFALGIIWDGVSRYVAIPQIAALSPVHCDITRFHLWSPIATGNHLLRLEKIQNFAQRTGKFDVLDPHSGDSGPT